MITKTEPITIQSEKVVTIIYTLRSGNEKGEILEQIEETRPLQFIYGIEGFLPKFEEKLNGLKTGESFSFGIKSREAYGAYNNKAVFPVPKSVFEINGTIDENILTLGNSITMRDNSGNKHVGVVKEVQNEFVKMDFNHPLAGKDLYFEGNILDIRDATSEELRHGHLKHECSCGGNCDCEGDCSCSDETSDGGCGCNH